MGRLNMCKRDGALHLTDIDVLISVFEFGSLEYLCELFDVHVQRIVALAVELDDVPTKLLCRSRR